MPDFKQFRRRDGGGSNLNAGTDAGFSDGFSDGFNDGFDDGFSDGLDDDFTGNFRNSQQDEMPAFYDGADIPAAYSDGAESKPAAAPEKGRGSDDMKAAFTALFKAISDRFTGKGKPTRDAAVDGSDFSFANEFDSAVDEGFALPQDTEEQAAAPREDIQPAGGEPHRDDSGISQTAAAQPEEAFRQNGFPRREYDDDFRDDFSDSQHGWNGFEDGYNIFDFPDGGGYDGFDENAGFGEDGEYDEDSIFAAYGDDSDIDYPISGGETSPEQETGGLFAALADALKKFRRRLPSFRPKVYVLPEPEYRPEQDGIGTPTLASDINRIIKQQNKPGETEREYNRMRSYIRKVSTDASIHPGDIKPPENLDELRAAENELYHLIDSISDTNEQQRRRIGVYEKPPEEDPYNYRGINNDRQLYTDMESYSFNMNSRYGFESEEKVDPGRKAAEMEYSRVYDQAIAGAFSDYVPDSPPADASGDGFSDGFDDDFDGGLDDDFESAPVDTGYDSGGGGFGDGFDDDLGDLSDGFGSVADMPDQSEGVRLRRRYDDNSGKDASRTHFSPEKGSFGRHRRG